MTDQELFEALMFQRPEPAGLSFRGQDGRRYQAFPTTESEAERVARWAEMDEDMRGRLVALEEQVKPVPMPKNPFQNYPTDFDDQLLAMIDRV